MDMLLTETGFYDITGNKDIKLPHSPQALGVDTLFSETMADCLSEVKPVRRLCSESSVESTGQGQIHSHHSMILE
ncbi:hypothetical protein STEG23_012016 [Scotinomys teguina]